jgi:hypothetical protein
VHGSRLLCTLIAIAVVAAGITILATAPVARPVTKTLTAPSITRTVTP